MPGIRTRYVPLAALPLTSGACANWLSREERAAGMAMRSAERRRSWLAGRIVAKQLLREMLATHDHPLAVATADMIHIASRCPQTGHGKRPVVFIDSQQLGFAMSIAHTTRGVLVAASLNDDVTLGVDLVPTHSSADKLRWTFSAAERCWLAAAGSERGRAEQLWAMKEAMYKACQRAEGFSPQAIEVVPGQPPRYPRCDVARELARLQCWQIDGQRAALAVVKNNTTPEQSRYSPTQLARAG